MNLSLVLWLMTNLKFAEWEFDALKPEVRSPMSRSIKFEIRCLKFLA